MGATVSVGFVASQPVVAAKLLGSWLVELRRALTAEPVLHADEKSEPARVTAYLLYNGSATYIQWQG